MKKLLVLLLMAAALLVVGCSTQADIASRNVSLAADAFEVNRRIVFYNGISGEYILTIEGLCSLGNFDPTGRLSVTCKTGPTTFKKHFLGLSDNVTYWAEHLDASEIDVYHYRVIFRPSTIIPDIELDLP